MPKDDIVSLGEISVGDDSPLPKYIAPLFRELTFGLVDDTLNYQYKELIPAIDDGYLPSPGGDVISNVPSEAVDVADVIGGITGEIAGEFVFGGMGTILGTLIRPVVRSSRTAFRNAVIQTRIKPSMVLEDGSRAYIGKAGGGDMIVKIVSPTSEGRIALRSSHIEPRDYLSVATIYVENAARGKGMKEELYGNAVEVAQKLGKKGIASPRSGRANVITDRFWLDNAEGTRIELGSTFDLLHNKPTKTLKPDDFNIVPADTKNPMLTGNQLMQEGAEAVAPLRKLTGKDRYGPIRPQQGDVINAWAVLGPEDIVKVPERGEGLVDVTIKRKR